MGWDYTHWATRADIITEIGLFKKVLKYKSIGNVVWTIWDNTGEATQGEPTRIIVCFLISKGPKGWGYKTGMSEASGPYYYNCPVEFLDAVPMVNAEWRAEVIKYHAAKLSKSV